MLLLLRYGAQCQGNAGNGVHGGALEAAVFKKHNEIVEDLLATDAIIEEIVIQAAVYAGNVDVLWLLLARLRENKPKQIERKSVDFTEE